MTSRCIIDAPRDGAANMAIDQALFEGAQAEGRTVLRLYRWQPGCLSLGRNQTARGVYDPATAGVPGTDIVRRPTGGLAVWHHHELTYSVTAPVAVFGRPRTAYHAIHCALAAGLAAIGASVDIAPARPAAGPLAAQMHPCFGEAAAGEVVWRGRKLVGSAMRFENHAFLQHGSILIDGDQSEVGALMAPEHAMSRSTPPITLREATGRIPGWHELYDAVMAGFAETLGLTFEPGSLTGSECARVSVLDPQYRSEAWTWRR